LVVAERRMLRQLVSLATRRLLLRVTGIVERYVLFAPRRGSGLANWHTEVSMPRTLEKKPATENSKRRPPLRPSSKPYDPANDVAFRAS
jgi:hypothetical protein